MLRISNSSKLNRDDAVLTEGTELYFGLGPEKMPLFSLVRDESEPVFVNMKPSFPLEGGYRVAWKSVVNVMPIASTGKIIVLMDSGEELEGMIPNSDEYLEVPTES